MNIKKFGFLILSFFLTTQVFAQTEIEKLVREGIQLHDKGEYDKAIETYKKALLIDSKSALVNYEIALSYFTKGDYEEAIKYSDIVLKLNKGNMVEAYMTKGSCLDMLGKTKESIKLFETAIKKTEGHYLLFYNLGLNYYKLDDFEKAEENAIKAIELNRNHASSHLMLANIHNQRGNTIQTLLASHFFLLLEPNSKRSLDAYTILQKKFGGYVSKDEKDPNTINITLSPDTDSQFGAAEIMLSMLEMLKTTELNKNKTEDELFVENTGKFFKILGELKKKNNKEVWWTIYIPFFYDIAQSEHLEAYCKYITQCGNENSKKWVSENESKLIEFSKWLKDK